MPDTSTTRKRVLSGMRATGKLHLGNYVGALENWVRMQNSGEYDCYYFIADWHALTTDYADTREVKRNSLEVTMDWLAAGLDPAKSTLFVQSHVKQHAELYLMLSMITPLGWLERVPTYKEQMENLTGKDLHTHGFLGYPVLQSADILLYAKDAVTPLLVPVGEDQAAHLEITREIARRFNYLFCYNKDFATGLMTGSVSYDGVFPEPQTILTPSPRVPGTDGRKMSKSYGNAIFLTDSEVEVRTKLKTMVTDPARIRRTDPGDPEKCPVWDLHKIYSSAERRAEVNEGCRTAGIGCIQCKGWVADGVVATLAPMQERRSEYMNNPRLVWDILENGASKARKAAEHTMECVREAMHLDASFPEPPKSE